MNIDKNIPIPPYTRRSKYPWSEMAVGDSILVTAKSVSIHASAKKYGIRVMVRETPEGRRCWRVE